MADPQPLAYASGDTRPPLSSMAIAALISGIASIALPIFAPVAITLGWVSQKPIAVGARRGKWLARMGIIAGVLGVVSGVMMAFAYLRARELAQQTRSMANLRQLGQLMLVYAAANRSYLPSDFPTLLRVIPANADLFIREGGNDLPAAAPGTPPGLWANKIVPGSGFCSYTYTHVTSVRIDTIRSPSTWILVYETTPIAGKPVIALFADGHVEAIRPGAWPATLAQIQSATQPATP